MITIFEVLTILSIHWIADFVFQDEKWATTKSHSIKSLLAHTLTYSVIWMVFCSLFLLTGYLFDITAFKLNVIKLIYFILTTFIIHTITDYFTSKIVSRKFKNNELGSPIPNLGAFSIIGFDQVLHYFQLFITYYILFL